MSFPVWMASPIIDTEGTVNSTTGDAILWTQHYTDGPPSGTDRDFVLKTDGDLTSADGQKWARETFVYDPSLFGVPPVPLNAGTRWQHRVGPLFNVLGPPGGTVDVTVASIDPANQNIVLHFSYTVNARNVYPAANGTAQHASHDVARMTGMASYEKGVLTSLSASGDVGYDMFNGQRLTYHQSTEATLQGNVP